MGILIWIIFGALVGWIASLLMGDGNGLIMEIIIGIVGAVIGGFIMNLLGGTGVTDFSVYSFLVALLGACTLIAAGRALRQT